MSLYLYSAAFGLAVLLSIYFSTLTYALRDFSKAKLAEYLGRHDGDRWFETLTEQTSRHIFVTAVCRVIANLLLWTALFAVIGEDRQMRTAQFIEAFFLAAVVSVLVSVALPLAVARYAAETVIGMSVLPLNVLGRLLSPLTKLMELLDNAVRRALGAPDKNEPEEIEQEILSAVEEGQKEGLVDEQERKLIENVIDFRDATAAHIMTARTEIAALEIGAGLEEVRSAIEASGYSRLPVYEQSLDKIAGILYARDLIKTLGRPDRPFDMRSLIRPAMFVPETKPLRNLFNDFLQQKMHIAIVLDEYGGTAGLVTIEDVLEELVGEITDEHEALEPAMFRKTADTSAEADARLKVSELNRQLSLSIPEDAGYETLGGFLMNNLGRIPEKGTVYEDEQARFTILDAEPRKINRVRIEVMPTKPHP